jgi:hypothetical protein
MATKISEAAPRNNQLRGGNNNNSKSNKEGKDNKGNGDSNGVTKAGLQQWQMARKIARKSATTQQSAKAKETTRAAMTRTAKARGKGKI